MAWMRQLLDWQREAADPGEFLEAPALRPGRARDLRVHAEGRRADAARRARRPVDFAYAVHTEVGHRCIGARVNGRLVALERKLENGEVVEIFTSKAEGAGPSRDWLAFVASPRAKAKIKQWFAKERKEEAIEQGKDAITKEVRRVGLPIQRLVSRRLDAGPRQELHYPDMSALYAAVGEGHTSARHVVQRLVAQLGGVEHAEEELADRATPSTVTRRRPTGDAGVIVKDAGDVWVKLARCCTPVPGDDILGFVTRGGGVSRAPHRLHERRRAAASRPSGCWTSSGRRRRRACSWWPSRWRRSTGTGCSRTSRRCWPTRRVNILSASVTTSRDRVAVSAASRSRWATRSTSGHVLKAVRSVEGVYDVYRVTSAS